MKRTRGTIAFRIGCIAVCALALCAMLVGCGSKSSSSTSTASEPGANLIGDWTVESMESGGESVDITSYSDLGIYILVTIAKDGTCTYQMSEDDSTSGTWSGKDANSGTVTFDNETFDATVAGGKLTLTSGSDKMVLASGKPANMSTTAAGTAGGSSGNAGSTAQAASNTSSAASADRVPMNFSLCDDSFATVTVTAKIYDSVWGAGYEVKIVNKSDKDIYVTIPWDSASVNGTMNDMTLGETVKAGKNATAETYFMDEVAAISDLKDVEGTLQIADDSSFDVLSEYTFTIPD